MRIASIILLILAVLAVVAFILMKTPRGAPVPHIDAPFTSTVFSVELPRLSGGAFPVDNTCDGKNESPEMSIKHVPQTATSLAFLFEDTSLKPAWTHWIVWDVPAIDQVVPLNSLSLFATEGANDFGNNGYGGPCPPKGSSPHAYTLTVYALDAKLPLALGAKRSAFDAAIEGHIVATTSATGTYVR